MSDYRLVANPGSAIGIDNDDIVEETATNIEAIAHALGEDLLNEDDLLPLYLATIPILAKLYNNIKEIDK